MESTQEDFVDETSVVVAFSLLEALFGKLPEAEEEKLLEALRGLDGWILESEEELTDWALK